MEKSLPKKVETEIVREFLNETLDVKFEQFEGRMDKKFEQFEGRMDKKFEQFEGRMDKKFDDKFVKLAKQVDMVGTLISNTHQEVRHFIELHKVLDGTVKDLERRVYKLENLVEKLAP